MKELPKKTTIVIVNDFDYIQGGASKVAIDTAKILHENGYHVIFFSGTHSIEEFTENGYQNITLNLPECLKDKNKIRGAFRGLYNFKAKKEFKKILDTLDPKTTIIHIHGWTKTLSSSVFDVADKQGFKVVVTLHDYFSTCPNGGFFHYRQNQICKLKPLSRQCLCSNCDSRNYMFKIYRIIRQWIQTKIVKLNQRIKYATYVSNFSYQILKPYFPQTTHFYQLYNPIDIEKKKKITTVAKDKFILYTGRITKEKGIELFCKAVTELNYPVKVIGDGPLLSTLKKQYPTIEFLGWKNNQELNQYYQTAHFFVFPSLWYETAGLTVLEAAQNNLYSLVSDTSASKEFVELYSIGETFHSGNVEDLKQKIKKLYNTKKKDIQEASKKIEEDLNHKKYLANILKIYYSILKEERT